MKHTATIAIAAIAILGAVAASAADVMPKRAKSFFENRRIAVSRDTTTLPGYVITRWERNGKPDTKAAPVTTNKLHAVVGKQQNNPLQAALELANKHIEIVEAQLQVAEAKVLASRTGLEEKRAEYVKKRDESKLPTTKAIYQAFIDVIDDILKKLDALAEQNGGAS